jgi:predicted CoA-binding protein
MAQVVAVIGASSDRRKFGNKAVRAFLARAYAVVPINPRESSVEGLVAYASVADVPGPIDVATLYVPPAVGIEVLEAVARKGIPEVWLNPGADSPAVVARAQELGLTTVVDCSIRRIGESPWAY